MSELVVFDIYIFGFYVFFIFRCIIYVIKYRVGLLSFFFLEVMLIRDIFFRFFVLIRVIENVDYLFFRKVL